MPRLLRSVLEKAGVPDAGRVSSGVDVVGDIAIVRLDGFTKREKGRVARTMLGELASVKVVMEQEGGISGEFRLRRLAHLAGEKRTLTIHRENGCAFKVDVARCYFSPRLSTERLRVADEVSKKERVLNMFAGVGPFTIPIARRAGAKVTSCELNGLAAGLHEENDRVNHVAELVEVMNADAAELPSLVRGKFDRVVMPHPSEADKFLPVALQLTKKGGKIHYYRHVLGEDEGEGEEALRGELRGILEKSAKYSVRRVRFVGPRWLEMAADIRIPR